MTKLKLSAVPDDKPVKLTVELSAAVHRDLVAYAEVLGRETGHVIEPARVVAPMLARFMLTDRGFAKARRSGTTSPATHPPAGRGTRGSPG
jgi:hypothetical protein